MWVSFPGDANICAVIVGLDGTGTVDDRDGVDIADGSAVDVCAGNDVVDCTRDGDAHAGGAVDGTGCSGVTDDKLRACGGVFSIGDVAGIIGVSQREAFDSIGCWSAVASVGEVDAIPCSVLVYIQGVIEAYSRTEVSYIIGGFNGNSCSKVLLAHNTLDGDVGLTALCALGVSDTND